MQAFSRDVERYWRAMAAEEATQLIEQRLQARDRQEQERQVQRVQAHLSLKLHEGRTTFDDFDDALAILDAALTGQELYGVLKQHVAQSPHGAALLRHVGLHPLVMQELQDRTPDGALRYLQSLEAQLGAPPPSPPGRRPSPPSPPRAPLPPPVHPLNGGGGLQTPMGTAPGDIVERQGSFRDYVRAVNQARTR
jgi:hypothetical protein